MTQLQEPVAMPDGTVATEKPQLKGEPDATDPISTPAPAQATAATPVRADDQPPDRAMQLYREAQAMAKRDEWNAGYARAREAKAAFIDQSNQLAWMLLERIDRPNVRIDVHVNMGPRERTPPDSGIIRPISFRIWAQGEQIDLIEVLDFEIGRFQGNAISAAIGKMEGRGMHRNFGSISPDAPYEEIRRRVIELVDQRHGG